MMCSVAMISAQLRRMQAQKLVSSRKPRPQANGKPQKVDARERLYSLTPEGARLMNLRLRQMEELEEGLCLMVSRKLEDELFALHRALQYASLNGHLRSVESLNRAVRQRQVRNVRRSNYHVLGRASRKYFPPLEPWEDV